MIKIRDEEFKKYACPVCGLKSIYTDMCDGCWNVERNLDDYLKYKEGRKRMIKFLKKAFKKHENKKVKIKKIRTHSLVRSRIPE